LTALGLKTQASSVEKTILGVGPVLEVCTVYILIPGSFTQFCFEVVDL